ncbi:MAG: flagellar basal body rod protein FlgC [Litoreibacter sp.]|nr:flagellar basal body rod protein FlgC [Litoreibacter sp.]
MSDLSKSLMMAASGMKAQSARLRLVSENMANADTPGYRRKAASFEQEMRMAERKGAVTQGKVRLDQTELSRIYDPSHPMADGEGYYDGSNVNIIIEIADAREAQRSYEANLKMFEQTRKMSSAVLELLRK